ncbi:unnamed protein product [Protopolystoma xenopodis]|uniref:Uncharacterized protein n=1 Tax=Protopolystoma xenopodis TaxID=117903 RepID=A0A3S5AYR9_9PLAT|nr:unnamed protein product [Protopolystoma xenopodis]
MSVVSSARSWRTGHLFSYPVSFSPPFAGGKIGQSTVGPDFISIKKGVVTRLMGHCLQKMAAHCPCPTAAWPN